MLGGGIHTGASGSMVRSHFQSDLSISRSISTIHSSISPYSSMVSGCKVMLVTAVFCMRARIRTRFFDTLLCGEWYKSVETAR